MKSRKASILIRLFDYEALSSLLFKVFMLITVITCILAMSGVLYAYYYGTAGIGVLTARITAIMIILVAGLYVGNKLKALESSSRRKRALGVDWHLIYALILLSGLILVFYVLFTIW